MAVNPLSHTRQGCFLFYHPFNNPLNTHSFSYCLSGYLSFVSQGCGCVFSYIYSIVFCFQYDFNLYNVFIFHFYLCFVGPLYCSFYYLMISFEAFWNFSFLSEVLFKKEVLCKSVFETEESFAWAHLFLYVCFLSCVVFFPFFVLDMNLVLFHLWLIFTWGQLVILCGEKLGVRAELKMSGAYIQDLWL